MSDTTQTETPKQTETLYTVLTGELVRERAPSRRAAVKEAKTLSNRRSGRVTVRRADGWEQLVYRNGELLESTLVTFDRRRKDRRLLVS